MSTTDTLPLEVSADTTPAQLADLIARELAGEDVEGLVLLQSPDGLTIDLPSGVDFQRAVIVGDSIALIQPDGSVIVLLGAADGDYTLRADGLAIRGDVLGDIATPEADWQSFAGVEPVDPPASLMQEASTSASESEQVWVGDPLLGLQINPLLPPTEYVWPIEREEEYAGRAGPGDIIITPADPGDADIRLTETDAPLSFRIADYYHITADLFDEALDFATVEIELSGLPAGTVANFGTLTPAADGTLVFHFSGSIANYEDLVLTLPTDFSTESRIDGTPGILTGTIHVTSILGDDVSIPLTLHVGKEGDIDLEGTGLLDLAETDAPVDFRPADALLPKATDIDGSEHITGVTMHLPGLPSGTLVSWDGGASFVAIGATLDFRGSLAEYEQIVIRLPTDFSTRNPPSSLVAEVTATTNEGGFIKGSFDVTLDYELDVDLSAPALLVDSEDSWGGDDSGVELALGISVAATDIDGSEDSTRVEIHYTGMPPGAYFLSGSFDAQTGIWSGSMAEANALVLRLPGDYSGTITSVIRAISPEGVTEIPQRIVIEPTGDVEFDIDELVTRETDAPLTVTPSSAWKVFVSDSDPSEPHEVLETVTLRLNGLPPGVVIGGVPASTISYDAGAGGTFVFRGSGAQYESLTLTFPTDFSTESPFAGATGALTGTISATSSEDPSGNQRNPVSLRIRPEGDIIIDDTLPDNVPDETDDPTPVTPSELLLPAATDLDGSESVDSILLQIQGLPGGSTETSLALVLPPGAAFLFQPALNGSSTLFIMLRSSAVGDVVAAYSSITFALPPDFSTANRSDLVAGTAMPMTLRLFAVTDEEANLGVDLPDDGQAIAVRVVDVGYEADLTLDAPSLILGEEDSIAGDGSGAEVDLGIVIDPVDIDGSEDEIFVEITFTGLPAGTIFMSGGTDLSPAFDPATGVWSGTRAEAEGLSLILPGDYSGVITSVIRAASPEGEVSITQRIEIAPVGDIDFDVTDLTVAETDLPVIVNPSSVWKVEVSDFDLNLPREELETITLTLANLPGGMLFTGVPGSTISYDATAGTATFVGTEAQYNALRLVFPADFSTESPDLGPITGTISATSNEDGTGGQNIPFALTITPEGDVDIDDTLPDNVPDETDDPTPVTPSELLLPAPTDQDGSESIETLVLVIEGLPAGSTAASLSLSSLPAGAAVFTTAADGSSTLTITLTTATVPDVLAAYKDLTLALPTDFSTANRVDIIGATQRPLMFTLTVETDEDEDLSVDGPNDGQMTLSRQVDIGYELDIDLSAPATVTGEEDGDGVDGGGVTVNLGISIAATDIDGSEDSTTVEIEFVDMPPGAIFNGGAYDETTGIWTGSMVEANALTLKLPGDYSGTITSTIRGLSPEGTEETTQTITITPTGDIDFDVADLETEETDAVVIVWPANSWRASISDADVGEAISSVTLTLNDLPPGVKVLGVPSTAYTYDEAAGGTLIFTGNYLHYELLTLAFPKDFSTTSPMLTTDGFLTGTLHVTSTEDPVGVTAPVRLRISEEGDVAIDDTMPDTIPDETDDPTPIRPADLLVAHPIDIDGSESLEEIVLTVTGLPAGSTAASLNLTGVSASFATFATAADGSTTMTITLDSSAGDVATIYNDIQFILPRDFSTANRADLTGGLTSLPLDFTLSVITDEDEDPAVDGPNDGQETSTRRVEIGYTHDITLVAPETISEPEDGGPNLSVGTDVDLQIDISIDDIDGSENEGSTNPADPDYSPFGTTVTIQLLGLPAGTSFDADGVDVTSQYNSSTGTWTGTVAQANALHLLLPADWNGQIGTTITVTTPEGSEITTQVIDIEPTSDTIIDGIVEAEETDAPVTVILSDSISILDPTGTETLTLVTIHIANLPAGTTSNYVGPPGGFSPDPDNPGRMVFDYHWELTLAVPVLPAELTLTFPTDFSTVSPDIPLSAEVYVENSDGSTADAIVPIIVQYEGDVVIDVINDTVSLAETDDPVDFKPSDYLMPRATDIDGSESVTQVSVTFNALPPGTLASTDGGVTFSAVTPVLNFLGTLAEYTNLVIRLPEDYSTANPADTLFAHVTALTDEGGIATDRLDVQLSYEEDLVVTGTGEITITENDAPGDTDGDNTSQAPLRFYLADAWTGSALPSAGPDGDDDGSETTTVSVSLDGTTYPPGSYVGYNEILTPIPSGPFTMDLTEAQYSSFFVQLPDDFSTATPLTGTVTFTTDEGGFEERTFSAIVTPEADVRITAEDITREEDYVTDPPVGEGNSIPLNLDYAITDIDGSETLTSISVTFTNLPAGASTVLSDGTGTPITLTGPSQTIDVTADQFRALTIESLPPHYSGIIGVGVTVVTNEGTATNSFNVSITPVAEPTIELSVDPATTVTEYTPGQFVVKEDTSFVLRIDADTPDKDGSEQLTQVVIQNVPAGWLPSGSVPISYFSGDTGKIAGATMSGTTLTITLNPGNTSFNAGVTMTPLLNDDRDVSNIVSNEMEATVTSRDSAPGLADNTATDTADVDVDVDAVVDEITIDTGTDAMVSENTTGTVSIPLGLSGIALTDTDGSETFTSLVFDVGIATASTDFDISRDVTVSFADPALAQYITISLVAVDSTNGTVTIEPAAGATPAQFAAAIQSISMVFPQHFSGVTTLDGTISWAETNLNGVEIDFTDNTASRDFTLTRTVLPVAEASLTSSVFVLSADEVAAGSPLRVEGEIKDGSITKSEILTLLESTDDGSSTAGQVNLFVGLEGSTPDTDGSEQLGAILIHNVPTDWLRAYLGAGGEIDAAAFYDISGGMPLSLDEYNKIDSATYDATTGVVEITFNPGVTEFSGALNLQPSLYEDYDVDRQNSDPFTSAGDFFGADLNIELVIDDTNTVATDDQTADVTLDVDVDPVNNFALVIGPLNFVEQDIDDAGGVAHSSITPILRDLDGSEQITALILNNVPTAVTVWVTDTDNPGGPKVPALITALNSPPGFNTWSLEANYTTGVIQWEDYEMRGLPMHFAGEIAESIDVVTTEANGGTRVTHSDITIVVAPSIDGGDPSETFATDEDVPVQIVFDGNLIDNPTNSPGSPEAIAGDFLIKNIDTDSFGRNPKFYFGDPRSGGVELVPVGGILHVTAAQKDDLWFLPGEDSNETVTFDIEVLYYETIDPTENELVTGTITVNVRGIADEPVVEVQDPEPGASGNPAVTENDVDDVFKADASYDFDLLFGYVGYDNDPFDLTQVLSELAITQGYDVVSDDDRFEAATPLSGKMTEITDAGGNHDGSETLYYVITGVDPATIFVGGFPIDATGESYMVPADELSSLQFVPADVSEVTFYTMQIHAIVVENDQAIGTLPGPTVADNLAYIDSLPGGSVVSDDLTIVVLPSDEGSDLPCGDEQKLPLPELALVGSGDEDTAISFQVKLTPNQFYDSIDDLVNLPNGVVGDFSLAIDLPPGATLSSNPPGAVVIDPVSGRYVVNLGALGVDPDDPTMTAGSIVFTPPPHQSSPENPFDHDDTLGPNDPYDGLNELTYHTKLVNVNCGTTQIGEETFNITINPIPDGPDFVFNGAASFDEDTSYALALSVIGIDGGERLVGDVTLTFTGGGTEGVTLYDAGGNLITPTSPGTYSIAPEDLAGLTMRATENFGGGTVTVTATATTEDVDGSTKANSKSMTINVIAVADTPFVELDESVIDPDTGLPFVDTSGPIPLLTIIEDIKFFTNTVARPGTPDTDGSEVVSIVLTVPEGLTISGPTGSGFIDNGDGTYTIAERAFPNVTLSLPPQHARTPDAINTSIPSQFELNVRVQTLEVSNSDTAEFSMDFIVRVRPDADMPTLTASILPTTGVEDSPDPHTLTLSASTPDPHESMRFEITIPTDAGGNPLGQILLDGVALTPVGGVVSIPATGTAGPGGSFAPTGVVTFVPAEDFAGDVSLSVVAVSIDADLDSSFVDEQPSAPTALDLNITPAPDLELTVDTPEVEKVETDAPLIYAPAGDFTIDVTDMDGSEFVDSVTYTLTGVPDETTWTSGAASGSASGGVLTFSGSLAEFNALQITFPTDFATNDTPITGTINVTTNEGGDESGSFTIAIDGELDLTVTNDTPIAVAQTGSEMVIDFGIDAEVTDTQAIPSETLESVVITFDAPVPVGTTASSGSFNAARDVLTFTRGATDPTAFAALVAALSITLPATAAAAMIGTISVSTNHGTAPDAPFEIDINGAPVVSGTPSFTSHSPVFTIPVDDLLAFASDPDGDELHIANLTADDPDVTAELVGNEVVVTVPNAFVGTPVLSFDIVDNGVPPATTSTTADLTIDTLQMDPIGAGPDGTQRMGDVTGAVGGLDIARATDDDDAVIVDTTTPFDEIEGFSMLGGNDIVDLSAATQGFSVDGGAGDDVLTGGAGDDVLSGGLGSNTLTGGGGADIFAMTDLTASDVISDYESPGAAPGANDQIDLSSLVQLTGGESVTDHVSYDSLSGALAVDGSEIASVQAGGGGFSDQVEVIFLDAAGAQATAVL